MNAVNALPTSAHMTPAATPPIERRAIATRVFGMKAYMEVNDRGHDRVRHELAEDAQNPLQRQRPRSSHCATGLLRRRGQERRKRPPARSARRS